MKLKPLHDHLIEKLKLELPEWRFSSKDRHFRRSEDGKDFYIHLSFINHVDEFDLVINVGVAFFLNKMRACVIGAELGSIEGVGQCRHRITSKESAARAALSTKEHLLRVGVPFLQEYSNAATVLSTLKAGGAKARLISPFTNLHSEQVLALEVVVNAGQ